jgi:type I restriction enzyme, S subunit
MTWSASTFTMRPLGELASIQAGYAFESARFTEVPTDVPLVKGENVQQGYVDWSIAKHWPETEVDALYQFLLRPGDVVVAMDRPWVEAGLKWAYIKLEDPQSLLVQRVARLRAGPELNQTYLRAVISSGYFAAYIQPIVTGVNVPHISGRQIAAFKVPVPSMAAQRKIAALISTYDDLIANNQRRIALLESMAEEIYREWFVRMRFPGHETAARKKGMPFGWHASTAAAMVHVQGGGTPSTEVRQYWDGEIPFFSPKDSHDGAYCLQTEQRITELGLENCASRLFPKNTIFITARGTVGNLVLAGEPMAMNQSCYALVPKIDKKPYFVFTGLKCAVDVIKGVSNSGVFDNVVMDTFKIIPLVNPGDALRERYNEAAAPIYEQSLMLRRSNIHLRITRDALLPRLISGKLRVDALDIQFPPTMLPPCEEAAQPTALVS